MEIKKIVPNKIAHFIQPEDNEKLDELVKDNDNLALYNTQTTYQSRSVLTSLRDVPAMLEDPIIKSALSCVMNTTFQTNVDNTIFHVKTNSKAIETELNNFHNSINAQNLILTIGYNLLLWGQLPFKHCFSDKGVLERVIPIPDFTKVTPIIISGNTIGFMQDGNFYPSYAFTYAQSAYYKNLGGNVGNRYVTISSDLSDEDEKFENEFTYADSYLSSVSQAWRSINIIEDALLLNRMDQSNYYRLISVNVGGAVYSKSAIKVLNFYRNLFKKVRRVSYDSDCMASTGNGQNFEVIIPQTQNQGVDVKNIGGEIDVKALKDLDTQYNRLFAGLQIQPSMIGFSSDVPSSLGDSTAQTWDKRFARVCKALSFSAFSALRNIDYMHLRSCGYNVSIDSWDYTTVSMTAQDDIDRGSALKTAVDNLKNISETLNQLDTIYDKTYLAKSLLDGALSSFGLSTDTLFSKNAENNSDIQINSNYDMRAIDIEKAVKIMSDNHIFKLSDAKEITSALMSSERNIKISDEFSPMTLKQLCSSVAVNKDTILDLKNIVVCLDKTEDEIMSGLNKKNSTTNREEAVELTFPIYTSKDMELTAEDVEIGAVRAINHMIIDAQGNKILTNKLDLANYIYLYMNGSKEVYCTNITRSK